MYSQASLADGPDTDGVEHLSAASPVATSAIEVGGFCEKSPAYPSRFLLKGALCTFGLLLMGLALGGGAIRSVSPAPGLFRGRLFQRLCRRKASTR